MPAPVIFTDEQTNTLKVMRAHGASWESIGIAVGVSTWRAILEGKALGVWQRTKVGPIGGAQAVELAGEVIRLREPRRKDFDSHYALPPNHPYALSILNSAPSFEERWGSD